MDEIIMRQEYYENQCYVFEKQRIRWRLPYFVDLISKCVNCIFICVCIHCKSYTAISRKCSCKANEITTVAVSHVNTTNFSKFEQKIIQHHADETRNKTNFSLVFENDLRNSFHLWKLRLWEFRIWFLNMFFVFLKMILCFLVFSELHKKSQSNVCISTLRTNTKGVLFSN